MNGVEAASGRLALQGVGLPGVEVDRHHLRPRAEHLREVERLATGRGADVEDARRRLHTNPLRILDSKNPAMQPVIESAPRLLDVDQVVGAGARHAAGLRPGVDVVAGAAHAVAEAAEIVDAAPVGVEARHVERPVVQQRAVGLEAAFPHTIAAAVMPTQIASGKFQGDTTTTTPLPCGLTPGNS